MTKTITLTMRNNTFIIRKVEPAELVLSSPRNTHQTGPDLLQLLCLRNLPHAMRWKGVYMSHQMVTTCAVKEHPVAINYTVMWIYVL